MNHILSNVINLDENELNKIQDDLSEFIKSEILNIIRNNSGFHYDELKLLEYYIINKKQIVGNIIERYLKETNSTLPYDKLETATILLAEKILPVEKYITSDNKVVIRKNYSELKKYMIEIFNEKMKKLNLNYYEFSKKLEQGYMKNILSQEYNIDLEDIDVLECYKHAVSHFKYLYDDEIKKDSKSGLIEHSERTTVKKSMHRKEFTIMGLSIFQFIFANIIAIFEVFGDTKKRKR